MQFTTNIPVSEIRNYCEFPPEWACLFDTGHPYSEIRRRINHDGGYTYEAPTELVNQLTPNTEN